jgi:hypothetical protein
MTTTQDRCEKYLSEISEQSNSTKPLLLFIGSGVSQYLTAEITAECPRAWKQGWDALYRALSKEVLKNDSTCKNVANRLNSKLYGLEDALDYLHDHNELLFGTALLKLFWKNRKVTENALTEVAESSRGRDLRRLFNASRLVITTNLDPICAHLVRTSDSAANRQWSIYNASLDGVRIVDFLSRENTSPRMLYLHGGLHNMPGDIEHEIAYVNKNLSEATLRASKYRDAYPLMIEGSIQSNSTVVNRTRLIREALSDYRLLFIGFSLKDFIIRHLLGQIKNSGASEIPICHYLIWASGLGESQSKEIVELEKHFYLNYGIKLLTASPVEKNDRCSLLDFILRRLLALYEGRATDSKLAELRSLKERL